MKAKFVFQLLANFSFNAIGNGLADNYRFHYRKARFPKFIGINTRN
jgi:hypothetical protein